MFHITPTITSKVVEASSGLSLSFLNRRWVMLIPYAVFLLIFLVLAGTALHRMLMIKTKGDATEAVVIVFVIISILIILVTFLYGLTINWEEKIF
jgi:hypothetical protein